MSEIDKPDVDLAIVLGYIAVKDLPTQDKKISVLTQLGFSTKDMAKIIGTNEQVVRTIKSKIKKG